ncbi:unnamed protein product [Cunninghamella echinulata]
MKFGFAVLISFIMLYTSADAFEPHCMGKCYKDKPTCESGHTAMQHGECWDCCM